MSVVRRNPENELAGTEDVVPNLLVAGSPGSSKHVYRRFPVKNFKQARSRDATDYVVVKGPAKVGMVYGRNAAGGQYGIYVGLDSGEQFFGGDGLDLLGNSYGVNVNLCVHFRRPDQNFFSRYQQRDCRPCFTV